MLSHVAYGSLQWFELGGKNNVCINIEGMYFEVVRKPIKTLYLKL